METRTDNAGRASWTDQFPGNFLWSNAMLVCKGMAPYGAVSVADIDRIAARLEAGPTTPEAWREAWCDVGGELEARAKIAAAAGHERTAGAFYLRAGNYLYTGERFVPPGPDKRALGERAFSCYHAGLRGKHPEIEFVEIACDGVMLPALFMPAVGARKRAPTVVVFNGMDNCKEMSILFAGLEFAARGFNTLAVDGPGQGESLRLRGISARHDYEVPAAAAYDMLAARDDVDPARIVVMGYSFGGYYAARVAAREKRYAAGIALTAGHWDLAAFQIAVREKARREQKAVAQSNFQFQWVVGAPDADSAIVAAERFGVGTIAHEIECPFLVTHGANDRIIPLANAQKLFDAVASEKKALRIFTESEGGSAHAHVDDRPAGIAFAADWLADLFAMRGDKA
jgi:alpha-beta hydrolase superfamily lysophospholipase